jgi:Holliday junction DNA helicase RuvA
MIGYLQGTLQFTNDKFILINVGGVGYKVHCNTSKYNLSLDLTGKREVQMFIHTVVREDALELFGFEDELSLGLFEKLISISGIGPRSGLGILAAGSVESLTEAIQKGDLAYLTAVSGIGKKTAEKIILELRGAISDIADSMSANEEVVMALKSLGYNERQIRDVLKSVQEGTTQERIKLALKYLGK